MYDVIGRTIKTSLSEKRFPWGVMPISSFRSLQLGYSVIRAIVVDLAGSHIFAPDNGLGKEIGVSRILKRCIRWAYVWWAVGTRTHG